MTESGPTGATEPAGPPFSLAAIAGWVGGAVIGEGSVSIVGLESIEFAGPNQLTFVASPRHARVWSELASDAASGGTRAAAALVSDGLLPRQVDSAGRGLLFVADADQAMISVLERFAPPAPVPGLGVDPTAVVHSGTVLGRGVRIGPHVSIDAGCSLGDGVVIHAGVRLYPQVQIGAGSVLHANCVVRERCVLGQRVLLHPGVMIGADGFGFRPDPAGRGLRKVPQIGTVEIHDDVEIGSGTCVDRAKFGATVIGAGTKIDNLVQIAHNCRIGRSCVIAGCVGLAGSVTIGDGAQLGGGVCVADHRTVGRRARIGAMSGVIADVADGATVLGIPAEDAMVALRQAVALRKLPEFMRRLDRELGRESA